jgi:hypothetical protein
VVTQSSAYRTPLGTVHIVGEVKNTSGSAIELVQIRVTAYDTANQMLAQEEGAPCLSIIPPGGDAPFDVPIFQAPAGIARYEFDIRARPTNRDTPSALDAGNIVTNTDSSGLYRLSGEVKNNSRQTYRFVQVCAGFYDANGILVRMDATFTNPPTLAPRESGSFEVSQQAPNIDSFRIWTTGQP